MNKAAKETKPLPSFEEAWPTLQQAFDNLISIAEGTSPFNIFSEDYMNYYKLVYEACRNNQEAKFYNAYKTSFEDYVSSKILPSLQGNENENDDVDLASLVRSWSNYKIVTRWFSRYMNYLERYYVPKYHLQPLFQTSYFCFYDKIYGQLNDQITNVVVSMIGDGRKGNEIDEKLLKEVLEMYKDMAESSTEHSHYTKELEEAIFRDAMDFYSNKISSNENYTQMVSECLEGERRRVSSYMPEKTQDELIKVIERELLDKREIGSNQATA